MANQNLIKARRKLTALFATGVEIRIGGRYGIDGEIASKGEGYFVDDDGARVPLLDDEVALWVQPPSPMQRDMAMRNANAARARSVLAIRRDEKSEEHLIALEFVEQMQDRTLYEYVLIGGQEDRQQDAIREILGSDEWKDITELQDSLRIFDEEGRPDDDPDRLLINEREAALQAQVRERENELRQAELEVLEMKGRESAIKLAMERRADLIASRAFMVEYERQMTFYSVRDPEDHKMLFFETARDLADSSDELLLLVGRGLEPFIKDGAEAKNLQRVESGSDLSDLPSKPATSDLSILEESIG